MLISELEARIRERAYSIWEENGRPEGEERQHWEQAMREVLASGRGETAKAARPAQPTKSAGARGRTRKAA